MEKTMTKCLLSGSTSRSLLAATIAAALMAAAPLASASAQSVYQRAPVASEHYGEQAVEADSDCGTILAQPGYASGFTEQACQNVVPGEAASLDSRHVD
jgi:hypothetical protein